MHAFSTLFLLGAQAQADTLFATMGGKTKVEAWVETGVQGHYPDPITKGWFNVPTEPEVTHAWNIYTHEMIAFHVYHFSCTASCRPTPTDCECNYTGRPMVESHKEMGKAKPITNASVYAAIWHFTSGMQTTGAGGGSDARDAIHDALWDTVPDVQFHSKVEHEATDKDLFTRLGGQAGVDQVEEEFYNRQKNDGMTSQWYNDIGSPKYVKITPSGLEVTMPDDKKPLPSSGYNALVYHMARAAADLGKGGQREWDELVALMKEKQSTIAPSVTPTPSPSPSPSGASSTTVLAVGVTLLLAALSVDYMR